jgi:hypothetical protein
MIVSTSICHLEQSQQTIYDVNGDSIIDSAVDLLKTGLQTSGTRHNSLFKIPLYLKYLGNDIDQTEQIMNDWMDKHCTLIFTHSSLIITLAPPL